MANKKIKVALASTLENYPTQVDIWVDNVKIRSDLQVSNLANDPLIVEHEFVDNVTHTLKIIMENDHFIESVEDMNLEILSVQLSDENFNYTPYTYLSNDATFNLRKTDNSSLLTQILWGENEEFILDIDTSNPTTFYDSYQYDLDNPAIDDGSTIV
jgi:hypothetical protein